MILDVVTLLGGLLMDFGRVGWMKFFQTSLQNLWHDRSNQRDQTCQQLNEWTTSRERKTSYAVLQSSKALRLWSNECCFVMFCLFIIQVSIPGVFFPTLRCRLIKNSKWSKMRASSASKCYQEVSTDIAAGAVAVYYPKYRSEKLLRHITYNLNNMICLKMSRFVAIHFNCPRH